MRKILESTLDRFIEETISLTIYKKKSLGSYFSRETVKLVSKRSLGKLSNHWTHKETITYLCSKELYGRLLHEYQQAAIQYSISFNRILIEHGQFLGY